MVLVFAFSRLFVDRHGEEKIAGTPTHLFIPGLGEMLTAVKISLTNLMKSRRQKQIWENI